MAESEVERDERAHERRVEQILRRARREVGLRDFLTFCGARLWTAVLAIGAELYAAFVNRTESGRGQD
jgi:hypothetical protein